MTGKKLKSNTGASLSIALLLFLICTVVSAVILTAATAAVGRAAGQGEADQRYYAVSSAASLLAEELEGKTVTVRCEKIVDTETTTKYIQRTVIVDGEETEVDDIETTSETLEPAYRVTRDADGNSFDAAPSFLTGKALELMFGTDKARNTSSINTSDIMNRRFIPGNEGSTEVHTLKLAQGASVLTEVKVESTIHSDGRLVCKLTSTAEDEDSDSFSLWLVMNPKVNESTTSETTTFVTPGKPNTETSRTVTAKISTISWTVSSIQREGEQFE